MRLVNLTPVVIRLCAADGSVLEEIQPTIPNARLSTIAGTLEDWGLLVPVAVPTTFGDIVDLPLPQDGTIFITSMLVAQRARRSDVLSPGTGPADNTIRKNGIIYGVTRLIAHV